MWSGRNNVERWKTNLAETDNMPIPTMGLSHFVIWSHSSSPFHQKKLIKILFTGCICECSPNSGGVLVLLYGILYDLFNDLFYNRFCLWPNFFLHNIFHLLFIFTRSNSGWAELVKSPIWVELSARKMRLSSRDFLLTVFIFFRNAYPRYQAKQTTID